MKAQTIKASEIEQYMKLLQIETRVKERMQRLLEISEYQLKLTTRLHADLAYISNWKTNYQFDPEVKALMKPWISNNITIPKLRKALGIENG